MYRVIFTVLAGAFTVCFCLLPVLEKLAQQNGLLTHQYPGKIDKRRVPYIGGIGMFAVFLLVCFFSVRIFPLSINKGHIFIYLFCAGLIVFFGFYDDLKELKPVEKLVGQSIAAFIFVIFAMRTQIIYFNDFFNIVLSLFWIVLLANAFNLLDILDGLAGALSIINIFTFFLFAILTNNHFVLICSACLLGVLFAFLRYNLPPARIFMGDAGSQFLGFSQAVMAISLSLAPKGREIGLLIPLVILAIPLFDFLFVILMRMKQGKSIFLKSNDHFVFKMLEFGVAPQTIIRLMIILSVITNSCAFTVYLVSNAIGSIVFMLVLTALIAFGIKLSRMEIS